MELSTLSSAPFAMGTADSAEFALWVVIALAILVVASAAWGALAGLVRGQQ